MFFYRNYQERPRPKQKVMWPYYLMIILSIIMVFLQIKSRLHYQEYQELFVKSEQEYFRDCLANNSYEECNYRNVNSNLLTIN